VPTDGVAIVSGVTYDFARRTTQVTIQPGGHLGVQDLVDWLARGRRKIATPAAKRVSCRGLAPSGAWNALPDETIQQAENPPTGIPEGYEETQIKVASSTAIVTRKFLTKSV
jgi:hypothetical protein